MMYVQCFICNARLKWTEKNYDKRNVPNMVDRGWNYLISKFNQYQSCLRVVISSPIYMSTKNLQKVVIAIHLNQGLTSTNS